MSVLKIAWKRDSVPDICQLGSQDAQPCGLWHPPIFQIGAGLASQTASMGTVGSPFPTHFPRPRLNFVASRVCFIAALVTLASAVVAFHQTSTDTGSTISSAELEAQNSDGFSSVIP